MLAHRVPRKPFSSGKQRDRLAGAPTVRSSPSTSLTLAMAAPSGRDLLIVGPGILGSHLGKLWLEQNPGCTVFGQTNTTNSHDRLVKLGLQPVLKSESPERTFPFVLFSAPPSGSQDYPAEVKAAVSKWDGTGSFVFTSSMSVCAVTDGGVVTEASPTVPMGQAPSTDKLLSAEAAVLEAGGNVVRYVGLYHCTRGAHTYFLKIKDVPRPASYVVNLIHYEDAARLAAAVLQKGDEQRGQVFLGCDNHPVTFKDMMAACAAVLPGEVNFTAPDDPANSGKRANNDVTKQRLGWEPKYASFTDFMAAGGKDVYNTSGLY